jgi:hypothetical protein
MGKNANNNKSHDNAAKNIMASVANVCGKVANVVSGTTDILLGIGLGIAGGAVAYGAVKVAQQYTGNGQYEVDVEVKKAGPFGLCGQKVVETVTDKRTGIKTVTTMKAPNVKTKTIEPKKDKKK